MDPLEELVELVKRWKKRVNITGAKTREEITRELILDSLKPLEFGLIESPVLDAGCGAGFPTLPLAVRAPEVNFVAVDSNRKKINFLKEAIRRLNLQNVEAVRERIENLEHLHGRFKTVLSKAFLPPEEALVLLRPFLAPGGKLIVYSTPDAAKNIGKEPHYRRVDTVGYLLGDRKRCLIVALT